MVGNQKDHISFSGTSYNCTKYFPFIFIYKHFYNTHSVLGTVLRSTNITILILNTTLLSPLQVRKLRLREVGRLAQGHLPKATSPDQLPSVFSTMELQG